jgi:cyclopropane fatty-acyl-phospholipid synthase-like methyltransferase
MESYKEEFDGQRAKLYEEALEEYPLARAMDLEIMYAYLNPQINEKILGLGEGNGYFCNSIASSIGQNGEYLITDPSKDQLENLSRRVKYSQVKIEVSKAENIVIKENFFDKVWSFGAFHHIGNQTEALKRVYKSLKKGGVMVICDVFQGSLLARHFDSIVARYCITGHEVKFLSEEFTKTLCFLAGFEENNVKIIELPIKWRFDSEEDLGKFIYKLHGMTLVPGSKKQIIKKVINGAKKILGVVYVGKSIELNWPMKIILAKKS